MNINEWHIIGLYIAAGSQILIAGLNNRLPRLMNWEPELEKLPLLIKEVFYIHSYFISIICLIFGVLTLRFAHGMVMQPTDFTRWFCGSVALFWAVRSIMQVTFYSSSHRHGSTMRSIVHWMLLLGYACFAVTYGKACLF